MNMITRSSKTGGADRLRNRFFARKRMLAEDFKIEQDYFINSQRLINRAVLGWGVVHGFKIAGATLPAPCGCDEEKKNVASDGVKTAQAPANPETTGSDAETQQPGSGEPEPATDADNTSDAGQKPEPKLKPFPLEVGPGFALDRAGRNVVLATATTITPENTVLLTRKDGGWCTSEIDGNVKEGNYVLAVHYAEFMAGGTVHASLCCCGEPERTHLCEGVVFSLRQDDCRCGEFACEPDGICFADRCGDVRRGPHARLTFWASERQDEAGVEPCERDGVRIALSDGLDLACVVVAGASDKCKPVSVFMVDASSPRRLVKTNDTLYDLLNGCDLTRIENISWRDWHRKDPYRGDPVMPWDTFVKFVAQQALPNDTTQTDFVVDFSGPVKVETVRRDAISITALVVEEDTGWVIPYRFPLSDLDTSPSGKRKLPRGTTDQFRVTVATAWVDQQIFGKNSVLNGEEGPDNFVIEIHIRGDLIIDCNGQAIDGNTSGLRTTPSGNGTPGGGYLSTFEVVAKRKGKARSAQ